MSTTNKLKCVFTPHYNTSKQRLDYTIERFPKINDDPYSTEWCKSSDKDYATSEMLKEGYIVEVHPLVRKEVING